MTTFLLVILFSLIGGLFSLIGGLILLRKKSTANKLAKYATPFAAGALLAAVFFDLLPEGVHESSVEMVAYGALGGILLFFLMERGLRWFHHHHVDDKDKDASIGLIVAGDTLHNALDGVAIASAFLISVPTGIVTTIVVAAHEIPHEIGDFGLMLHKGMRRKKVLLVNVLSSLTTTAAAIMAYWLGSQANLPIGILVGISAGFLLYIALTDVVPDVHEHTPDHKLLDWRTGLLILGVVIVGSFATFAHQFVDHGHDAGSTESSQHEHMADDHEHHDHEH